MLPLPPGWSAAWTSWPSWVGSSGQLRNSPPGAASDPYGSPGRTPRPELRDLFDSLRLQGAFQPAEAAVDGDVALFADEPPDRHREVAEVQSVLQLDVRGHGANCLMVDHA
jgi:hypothetical protein